mmetsp:Transcript_17557/g.48547  ORF Transcript_17557/g.48547 Transcript_17557/m.48547 type:complete len:288 (-) Transcript_17557:1045-1908(-)
MKNSSSARSPRSYKISPSENTIRLSLVDTSPTHSSLKPWSTGSLESRVASEKKMYGETNVLWKAHGNLGPTSSSIPPSTTKYLLDELVADVAENAVPEAAGDFVQYLVLEIGDRGPLPGARVVGLDLALEVRRELAKLRVLHHRPHLLLAPNVEVRNLHDEGRDGAHAEGEDHGPNERHHNGVDALHVGRRRHVPVSHCRDGDDGPVQRKNVALVDRRVLQARVVLVHPVQVIVLVLGDEREEAAEQVAHEDEEEGRGEEADGGAEGLVAVLLLELAKPVHELDGAH